MDKQQLKSHIESNTSEVEFMEEDSQFLHAIVKPEHLHGLAKNLKESAETSFDYLFCLSGVDWSTHLMVVYHLRSVKHGHSMVLKVKIEDRENPRVATVSDIWKTADFHEREVYDLFGVVFNDHPDLRRIFLEDDWQGYPLRKDYVDEINIVEL